MNEKTGKIGEFLLITVGAFAFPILSSLLYVISPAPTIPASGADLTALLVYECIVTAILWIVLRTRAWSRSDLGLNWQSGDLAIALVLAVAFYASYWMILGIADGVGIQARSVEELAPIDKGLGLPLIAAFSVVNPVFEEVFVCGYTIMALARIKGPWVAINVSIAIRLAYHLYQGTTGVMSILPMGFISALWFARTGRLWPVIIAHGLLDFIALYQYA